MPSSGRLQELRTEARHQRQRYDLYRARAYGMHPTSAARLEQLQRTCEAAEERLRNAVRLSAERTR